MNPLVLALTVGYLLAGLFTATRSSTRAARTASTWIAALTVPVSILGPAVQAPHNGWFLIQPALICTVTLVAVALSSLARTRAQTYGAIFGLGGLGLLMGQVEGAAWLALLWVLVLGLTWWEARHHSRKASALFSLYLGVSSLLLLLGIFTQSGAFLVLIALALCIREACFPFQSWFLSFVEELPMGLVVAFTCPQLGVLFHIRFLSGQLSTTYHQELAILGALTALFGAALATVQPNLRRILGYLIISQSGLVAFGIENSSQVAHAGALACWLVVGLASAGFAMSIEALESRSGGAITLDTASGNFETTPALATAFLLTGMSMVGLPGSLGLVAEDLLVQGSVHEFPALGFTLILVTALNAMTIIKCLLKIFAGSTTGHGKVDLVPRERFALSMVLLPLFFFGLFPSAILNLL